jgi:hypothetical protein
MYLPGFSNLMRRSRAKTEAAKVMREAQSIDGLAALVARFIPTELFRTQEGARKRLFTSMVTFTAFLGQVMRRGSSCREAVRHVQAWFLACGKQAPDDSTSAYCQARNRLGIELIRSVFDRLCTWFEEQTRSSDLWQGRKVKIIDGTGISMPDTQENRASFEYAGCQREGCGFPTGKLVALFSLATGHLVRFVHGNWKEHDISMARSLIGWIESGDVLLADCGFCGWGFMASLMRKKVDVVVRLHQARKVKAGFEQWKKPQRGETWDAALWSELPDSIEVRILRYKIEEPGFRTKEVVLATTLLDTKKYPDEAIMELFRRRWQVELNLRDIKGTLGLDVLRSKSPELIHKEIYMQAIAYNIVRGVMLRSAREQHQPIYRLSFKGTVDTLRQWTALFGRTDHKTVAARWEDLLCAIASDVVPKREGRSEPRAVKRRPKVFQQLTAKRDKMVVSKSRRNKGRPNAPKTPLT